MILLISAIVAAILIITFTESGDLGWTIFVLLSVGFIVIFVDKRVTINDIAVYAKENILFLIGIFLSHVLIGMLWGLVKWKWYCEYMYDTHLSSTSVLKANNNKARITGWMLWWELSLAWWLIHRPITKLYSFICTRLYRVLDNISQSERKKRYQR